MNGKPYEISIIASRLPSVIINAPSIEAAPRAWRTRLQWAWRCLRGKPIDLHPSIILSGNHMESMSMVGCNVQTYGTLEPCGRPRPRRS